jgi:hypothetical protein
MIDQERHVVGDRRDAAARQAGRLPVARPVRHHEPDTEIIERAQPFRREEHRAGHAVLEQNGRSAFGTVEAVGERTPIGQPDLLRIVFARRLIGVAAAGHVGLPGPSQVPAVSVVLRSADMFAENPVFGISSLFYR